MPSQTNLVFNDEDEKLEFHNRIGQFQDLSQFREDSGITSFTGLYGQLPKRFNKQPKGFEEKIRIYSVAGETPIHIAITPAIIKKVSFIDGVRTVKSVHRYPTIKEDNVEEILGYIAALGGAVSDPTSLVVGVHFTIKKVIYYCEKIFKVKYNHNQVLEALDILARSSLTLQFEGHVVSGSRNHLGYRINNLETISKDLYLTDTNSKCYCEFHRVFARDISLGHFFAHDLTVQSKLKLGLSTDIFRRLSCRYRNASKDNSYNFMAKEVLSNSPIGFIELSNRKSSENWVRIRAALEELKEQGLISSWDSDIRRSIRSTGGSKKIEDMKITVHAGDNLIALQKLSHKADKVIKIRRSKAVEGVPAKVRISKSYDSPPDNAELTTDILF